MDHNPKINKHWYARWTVDSMFRYLDCSQLWIYKVNQSGIHIVIWVFTRYALHWNQSVCDTYLNMKQPSSILNSSSIVLMTLNLISLLSNKISWRWKLDLWQDRCEGARLHKMTTVMAVSSWELGQSVRLFNINIT